MAPHSSALAWKIPWTQEPGGLQSMELPGVWLERVLSLSLFHFMHWRRKWQPTLVFLPGVPGTAEPGGLLSMGSPGIGHDWSDLAAAAAVALQHSVGFRHTSTWISHRYTYVPSLLKLPPFSHTSSHASRLSATDGSFLCHATNYHWLSSLHMVLYMIPCCSLTSSYPLFPSLCPQVNLNIFQKYFIKKPKSFYSNDKLYLRCDSSNIA